MSAPSPRSPGAWPIPSDYLAFSPDKLRPWDRLIAFIPNAASWLGKDEETARVELAERIASAPI